MKIISRKKIVLCLFLAVSFSTRIFAQESFKDIINKTIDDYLYPTIGLAVLLGLAIGLIKNWKEVNHPETRQTALINIGVMLLYVALIFGAIVIAAEFITRSSVSI